MTRLRQERHAAGAREQRADPPRGVVLLFAVAGGLSVANVYDAQPLLDAMGQEFGIGEGAVGGIFTATQLGCALALLLLVPLGDRVDRRRLMGAQLLCLVCALGMVAAARSAGWLLVGMMVVGLLGTAMTQGLIAYAASVAPPHAQGRVVGTAQAGVFVGLLLARVFAGGVSDLLGWRGVYLCSAVMMIAIALALWRWLPTPPPPEAASYRRLIASLPALLRREKMLRIRGVLGLLMFAVFNIFWNALALALRAPPHAFSHTVIGAFGLAGAAGALAAARAGRWVDNGHGQRVSAIALALLILAWWPLSLMQGSLWALVIGIVILDLGGQALHVTNQALILRTCPAAAGRLVSLYMLFYAAGSGIGAIATTATYARAGWPGVCGLGFGTSVIALVFWATTRPRLPRHAGIPATSRD